MPASPAAFQRFCESLGIDERHHSTVFWTGLLGLPAAWWALSSRSQPPSSDTHIDAFFKQKPVARPQTSSQPKRQPTSFHSFLKDVPQAHKDPTSFGAFLKGPSQTNSIQATSSSSPASGPTGPQETDCAITVLFGTEYGFSKEVAERVAAAVTTSGPYWADLVDMAEHPQGLDLSKEQLIIAVCSTQGDGVPPSEAREFCDWLASDAAPALSSTQFAVCALGDRSYAHFCNCGKQLDSRFEALGGRRFADRVDVHREDLPAIATWLSGVTSALKGMQLKTVADLGGFATTAAVNGGSKPKKWGKSRPFYGEVVAVEGLCQLASADDKDTIRVEIDLGESGLQYTPGDALGVYPLNCPQAVRAVVEAMGQEGSQQVPCPSWHYQEQQQASGAGDKPSQMPLQEALTKCYDLRTPKVELLQLLFEHLQAPKTNGHINRSKQKPVNGSTSVDDKADNQNQHGLNGHNKEDGNSSKHVDVSNSASSKKSDGSNGKLQSQADGRQPLVQVNGHTNGVSKSEAKHQAQQLQDILQQEAEEYLEQRHIIDILQDFSGSHPPLASLLACLRPLQPRLYSISSSQLEHPTRVQITVAVVRYASLGLDRIGVTSTFLKERMQVGDHVPVYIAKNPDFRLPPDLSTPIIMVGPGTGLAPFRSFMQERLHQQQSSQEILGECVLYFGCRRCDQDYLYASHLEQWQRQGSLTLFTAFSRQQAQKVYVQDRIQESGELIWKLLEQGAHFYVCGDAAHMAGSVEKALLGILKQACGSQQAADDYLAKLQQQHKYERDVWF